MVWYSGEGGVTCSSGVESVSVSNVLSLKSLVVPFGNIAIFDPVQYYFFLIQDTLYLVYHDL